MLQQQGKLEQDIGMATQAKEQYLAEAKADIATQERQAAQKIEADLDATRKRFPYPEFHPTKDNIESLSTLFGLIGVIGAALGGSGKMSATASLNAMGGMMKGWQQGRSDLWKKEKEEFDKGMLKVKAVLEDAYKDADRAIKTLAYNRSEAEALATQSAAKLGGQVGKQILAKQGVERYFAFLDGVKKDLTEAEKRAFEQTKFAAEQAHRKKLEELREKEITAKAAAAGTKGAGAAAGQIERMTNAMTQVSGAIKAISDLPVTTTSPVFGQKEFKGLFVAPLSVLNQNMSKETSQMMAGRMVGVARNLASLETGGAATGLAGLTDSIQAGISIPAGAKLHVALDRLAEMRRIVEDASRGALASSKYTPDQKQLIKENLLIVQNAIPFTLEDVAQATIASKGKSPKVAKEDRNLTFTQYIQKYGLAKPEPIESAIQSGGETSGAETPQDATRVTGLPLKNAKGWTLHNDGKGGYAYVSPNGVDFEEAE
jgi:hypothetical protein